MAPIFPDVVHGGSQKTLAAVLEELSERGHKCKVFCAWRPDNSEPFTLFPRVRVYPFLRFKPTYPEPHYTAPYHLSALISLLTKEVEEADVFYIHDSELLFSQIFRSTPTIWGVQDLVYPDTLAGVFTFQRDRLIVPSAYMRECLLKTLGRCTHLTENAITLAPNGFSQKRPVSTARARESLKHTIGLKSDLIPLLYPHRPDPRKGLMESLHVIKSLRSLLPQRLNQALRLLVPIWVDSRVASDSTHSYQTLYSEAQRLALELDLPNLLHFHPWLRQQDMATYYELGAVTLCIGNFIESFGNVSIESQLAGTPALVSRVGAQRTVLPDEITWKCDFGQISAAAEMLARLIRDRTSVPSDFAPYVNSNYGEQSMKNGYVEAIEQAKISHASKTRPTHIELPSGQSLSIPPWCANLKAGYYNDYAYDYCADAALLNVIKHLFDGPQSVKYMNKIAPCTTTQLTKWTADGHLYIE